MSSVCRDEMEENLPSISEQKPPPPTASLLFHDEDRPCQSMFHRKICSQEEFKDRLTKIAQLELDRMPEDHKCNAKMDLITLVCLERFLQNGPICGLAAASDACAILGLTGIDPEMMFKAAKEENCTKQGEMFSAYALSVVLSKFQGVKANLVDISGISDQGLAELIFVAVNTGSALLIPYDSDFNHRPALRLGHAAHWAVIYGIASLSIDDKHPLELNLEVENTSHVRISFVNQLKRQDEEIAQKSYQVRGELFVVANQGKSSHTYLWKLSDLFESNRNLREVNPRITSNNSGFVLDDISESLRNKIISVIRA